MPMYGMAVFLREIFASFSLMPLTAPFQQIFVSWSFTASATDLPFPMMRRSSATILTKARPSMAWSKHRWKISPVGEIPKAGPLVVNKRGVEGGYTFKHNLVKFINNS